MNTILATDYSIIFNEEAFAKLNEMLKKNNYSKIFIIVDENTNEFCLPKVLPLLATDTALEIIELESGEINKNIQSLL